MSLVSVWEIEITINSGVCLRDHTTSKFHVPARHDMALVDEVRDAYLQFTGVDMPIGFIASCCHTAIQETMAAVEDMLHATAANKYHEDEAEEGEEDENDTLGAVKAACSKITDFFTGGSVKIVSDDVNVDTDTDPAIDGILLEQLKKLIRRAGMPSQRTGVKIKMIELGRLLAKLEQFMDEDAFEEEFLSDEDGEDDEDAEEVARELEELSEYTDPMAERKRKTKECDGSDDDSELMAKKYKRVRREASFRMD